VAADCGDKTRREEVGTRGDEEAAAEMRTLLLLLLIVATRRDWRTPPSFNESVESNLVAAETETSRDVREMMRKQQK
jgi:hypothetical protein